MATAPGFSANRPRPAPGLQFTSQARDLPMLATVARRGPLNKLRVLSNGYADYRKVYGGTFGDEPGPYGARWFTGPLAVARVSGSVGLGSGKAKYGSRRVLDMLGKSTLVISQRNPGAWGASTVASVAKVSTTMAATATNTAGTILSTTAEIGLGSYTNVEVGDIFFATDGTNTAVGVIWKVEPSTPRVQIFTKAGWCSGTVAAGSPIAISSYHLAQTTTTQALASGATSLTIKSAGNIKKGSVLMVQHVSDGATAGTEPISLTVTGVSGNTVSFAAYSGTTMPSGSFVSSQEFFLSLADTLEDGTTYSERLGPLSLSDTYDGVYVGDVLGGGLSFSAGSTATTTDAVTGAIASGATSATLTSGGGALVVAGDWYQFGTGLQAQIKAISGDTVYFDNVGTISTVAAGATVKPLTMTVTDSDDNKSELVIVQEMNAAGTGDSATTPEFMRLPRPIELGALTGGVEATAPTGSSQVLGSAVTGAKSGIRLAEDSEHLPRIAWLAAPGFDGASSANRAALDNDVLAWCEANLVRYLTSAPTTITKPEEMENYRLATLGADTFAGSLIFQRVWCRSLAEGAPRVKMPPDVVMLWLCSSMAAEFGIQQPKANQPFPADVLDVDVTVTSSEHGRLDDVGVICLVKKAGRVRPMGSDSLYRARKDKTKLHHSNAGESLMFILRSLQGSPALEGFTFSAGQRSRLADLQDGANEWAKRLPAGMLELSENSIEFVCDESTTSDEDVADGTANVSLFVSLAGAWKRVNLTPYLMTGSVRERKVA